MRAEPDMFRHSYEDKCIEPDTCPLISSWMCTEPEMLNNSHEEKYRDLETN